jgi:hypothetical protein
MSGTTVRRTMAEEPEGSYAGWYIGTGMILGILAIAFGLWFYFHPL